MILISRNYAKASSHFKGGGMTDNMKLWRDVEKTDPQYTKKANVKGNKITSVAPQYQIMKATEQFGSYGKTWGFKKIELDYSIVDKGLVVFHGTFFFPDGEFQIINTIGIFKDNAQTKLDDDFAKKVETDALTKALSKLGFNADIFMGRYDDARYVNEITQEFNEKANATDQDIINITAAANNNDITWIQANWNGVITAKWGKIPVAIQNKLQGK